MSVKPPGAPGLHQGFTGALAMCALLVFACSAGPAAEPEPVNEPKVALSGQQLFVACSGCHVIDQGETHLVGPDLFGIIGRRAGAAPGFAYSPALAQSEIVWNRGSLTAWILATEQLVPGTWMLYHNILEPQEVNDLVDFLIERSGPGTDG